MKNALLISILFLPLTISAMQELKEQKEVSPKVAKINAYRSECLEKHLPKVLSNLVQEYDPIQDKWKCEITLEGHSHSITSLYSLPENKLLSNSHDSTTKIWNLSTGKCEVTLSNIFYAIPLSENKLALVESNTIEILDRTIKILDLDSKKDVANLVGHKSFIYRLCLLPDNKLASASSYGTIKIWDLNSYECEATLNGHKDAIFALCLLPGNKLASGSADKKIRIWNLKSRKCEAVLKGHTFNVNTLCLLPKNKLASGSCDGKIKIWDLESKKCETTLDGHKNYVFGLCLLPGNKLVSCSDDGTVKIWDLETGQCETTLDLNNPVYKLCSLPGNKLAFGTPAIQVWANEAVSIDFDKEFIKFMHEKESLLETIPSEKENSSCVNQSCIIS